MSKRNTFISIALLALLFLVSACGSLKLSDVLADGSGEWTLSSPDMDSAKIVFFEGERGNIDQDGDKSEITYHISKDQKTLTMKETYSGTELPIKDIEVKDASTITGTMERFGDTIQVKLYK